MSVTGRMDDVINSGGKLISPQSIEDILRTHAAISDVVVVGLDDERWGHRVVACLILEEQAPDSSALRDWCRHHLSPGEVPKEFRVAPKFECTELGKVKRQAIRRQCEKWPMLEAN